MQITKCRILRLGVIEGVKTYQVELSYENGMVESGTLIPFEDIEGKNNVVRYPSINKVRDWLNSNEGLEYLNKHFNRN